MAPSESAPQELSNERSCQRVLTILNFGGQVLSPAVVRMLCLGRIRVLRFLFLSGRDGTANAGARSGHVYPLGYQRLGHTQHVHEESGHLPEGQERKEESGH
jgi:hypothetical protein